MIFDQGLRR